MQNKEKVIISCIIIAILAFGCGFLVGVEMTIKKGVYLAHVLMDDGSLNITYNDDVLESLIRRYINSAKLS